MVVNRDGTPEDLTHILSGGENSNNNHSGQTTFNKMRIDEHSYK
jgi:hypothetical protein